ncbi:MAG: spermidine synthase [Planctomycetes bacterium]|nr:spermidine synthase [Planctomycetota bacterium]
MKPRELIATANIPGQDQELRCYHHDGAYAVWVGNTELMSTRVFGSEEQLAELALERLGPRKAPRVLVGGLGMGFTLRRALQLLPEKASVEVVELVPEVVTWNREIYGQCAGHPLQDPRVTVTLGDVREAIENGEGAYDAILLDVDNGPEGLARPGNDSLYNTPGLKAQHRALKSGGVVAVWSSADHPQFDQRLRRGRWAVSQHRVRARRDKGPVRFIWVALRT